MIDTNRKKIKHEEILDAFYLENPELYEIYQNCSKPPKDAYLYFPKGEEVMIYNEKKPNKSLRRIYQNQAFTQQEYKWIEEFKQIIRDNPGTKFPYYWNDAFNLTVIYSTDCHLDKAFKRMVLLFEWYEKTFPMLIQPTDNLVKLLNNGFIYIYGRDHQFRPIIVCQTTILINNINNFSKADIINSSVFLAQYMVNHMLIPGQIENWVMWINAKGSSVLRIPDSIKEMIKILSDGFLARLYRCYVFGMSTFMRFIYKIICKFLEEVTINKIIVLEGLNDPKRFKDISPQNLEKKFGGEAPDVIYDLPNGLFPPRMPSYYFLKDNEDPNEVLISEQEYINRYLKGEIPNEYASPFIIEKLNRLKEKKEKEKEQKRIEEINISQIENTKINEFQHERFNTMMGFDSTEWFINREKFDRKKFKNFTKNNNTSKSLKVFGQMKKQFCENIFSLSDKKFLKKNFSNLEDSK